MALVCILSKKRSLFKALSNCNQLRWSKAMLTRSFTLTFVIVSLALTERVKCAKRGIQVMLCDSLYMFVSNTLVLRLGSCTSSLLPFMFVF